MYSLGVRQKSAINLDSSESLDTAVLQSATVSGTTYRGTRITNRDIYDVSEAGVYTVSNISIKYNMGSPKSNVEGYTLNLGGKTIKDTVSFNTSEPYNPDATNSMLDSSGDVLFGDVNLLLQATLNISSQINGYMSNNFGIAAENRTYGASENFRELIGLHKVLNGAGGTAFNYSSQTSADYDVSSGDDRRFKTPLSVGLGNVGQTVASGAQSGGLTNLSKLSDYLEINWYTESYGFYEKVEDAQIYNAGQYYLSIEAVNYFGYSRDEATDEISVGIKVGEALPGEYQPVVVKVENSSSLYRHPLEILKRRLYVETADFNGGQSIDMIDGREYNADVDAQGLFVNVKSDKMSRDYWINVMNGLGVDYDAINKPYNGDSNRHDVYINEGLLFEFDGSVFADPETGKNKNVYLAIKFRSFDSARDGIRAAKAADNYQLVPRYNGSVCTEGSGNYANKYLLSGLFEIRANTIGVYFSTGSVADGKPQFPTAIPYGRYIYGDARADGRDGVDFDTYMVANNTVLNGSLLQPQYRNNWKIVFQSGRLIPEQNPRHNTIYIVMKTGIKKPEGSSAATVYVDADGQEYVDYQNRLFAGEYYFYYEVSVVYLTNTSTTVPIPCEEGVFSVPGYTGGESIFRLETAVQYVSIDKKKLTVTVDSINIIKDYDGTDTVPEFKASVAGIIDIDAPYIKFNYSASYLYVGAGDEVPIKYLLELAPAGSQNVDNIISSYELDTNISNAVNPTRKELVNGVIRKLDLTFDFIETEYSRKYDSEMYVAVRVGRKDQDVDFDGNLLSEDFYYVYDTYRSMGLFALESQIRDTSVGNSAYVKLSVSGFLDGEGFTANRNDLRNFMLNRTTASSDNYESVWLTPSAVLSWFDTLRDTVIDRLTPSSQSPSDTYRLEFSNDYSLPNYNIVGAVGSFGYLLIDKLDVSPDDIKINDNSPTLTYNAEAHITELFGEGRKIYYGSHKEQAEILTNPDLNGDETKMLQVLGFVSSCTDASHIHDFDIGAEEIRNFVIAGVYTVQLTIPSTTNYNEYVVVFEAAVNTKSVDVYLTYAWRIYGDPALEYNPETVGYVDNIEDYAAIGNQRGDVSTVQGYDGNPIFIYGVDLAPNTTYAYGTPEYNEKIAGRKNYILYSGFVAGQTFGDGDTFATVTVNLREDAAGYHENAVIAGGASKHNYSFVYHATDLYVKTKPLTITAEENQRKNYTGNEITPDYTIGGGRGVLFYYIIGYNGKMDDVENEQRTGVVETGRYVLRLQARPDPNLGQAAANYEASLERPIIELEVIPTQLNLIDGSEEDSETYDGKNYDLQQFDAYFKGVAENGRDITAHYNWGTVEIKAATDGSGADAMNNLIAAGKYELSVEATITNVSETNDNKLNVYFLDSEGNETNKFNFTITLTIDKSNAFVFSVVRSQGVEVPSDGSFDFRLVYNAEEATFRYGLTLGGEDYSDGRLSVLSTVNGYLYGVNQKIYTNPNEVASLTQIDGIDYDITKRPHLLNVGTYTIEFFINNENYDNYNPNYVSEKRSFVFRITEATLRVYIEFKKEGTGPFKVYKTDNTAVERNASFNYVGWLKDEGDEGSPLWNEIGAPVIDFSEVADINATVGNGYTIRAMDNPDGSTKAPSNYVFDYAYSSLVFEILRAEARVEVYGTVEDGQRLPYSEYNGWEQEPMVIRISTNGEIITENIGNDGITINYEGLLREGANKTNIKESDIDRISSDICRNAGGHVFSVSVIASQNYEAIPKKYYYFEITKARLEMQFVEVTDYENMTYTAPVRGYTSKIYDGQRSYPYFNVIYSGFLGSDASVLQYRNVQRIVNLMDLPATPENLNADIYGIPELGLVHPYYRVYNRQTETTFFPEDVGLYEVRLFGGSSQNYILDFAFERPSDSEINYPQLEITKRQLDVVAGDIVQKVYDATVAIPENAVTQNNYRFTKVKDGYGVEIENSGLVDGDIVNATFDRNLSRFERKDVHDADGAQSYIYIRIYGFKISDDNYELNISELFNDENGEYLRLVGLISAANAEINFTDESGTIISVESRVTYDGERHGVIPVVRGVMLADGTREEVEFSLTYDCDESNYHSAQKPRSAGKYLVTLTIEGSNYVAIERRVDFIIDKAEVTITFGGDTVQIYGSVIGGLSAAATGVGGYGLPLNISYYDELGEIVRDISVADSGIYRAVAVHAEAVNFKYSEAEETFTVKRRPMAATGNVLSSYVYDGTPVKTEVYFTYNGVRYEPKLKFDIIKDGTAYPFNYGDGAISDGYPVGVGEYRLMPLDEMKNFEITDSYWINFRITPVNLTITVYDATVTAGQSYSINFKSEGLVSGDGLSSALTKQPSVEFYTAAGVKLDEQPSAAGTYRAVPYGAEADNYVISYNYGIININKSSVKQNFTADSENEAGDVIIEGSFLADVTLEVRQADTLAYNRYKTMFDVFSLANEDYGSYGIAELYSMRMSDGSVVLNDGGVMTVKIYAPSYFARFPEETSVFFVARIDAEGNIQIIEAAKDGDYLVFNTTGLETFALLANNETIDEGPNLDWLLYVGIAVGVVLIGVALLIVKLRD